MTTGNGDPSRDEVTDPSELPTPYMLTPTEEVEFDAHVTGEHCESGTPIGAAACSEDFGSAIHSTGRHDLYRNIAGVWRFCSDNVAEIEQTGPATPRAFDPHAGIEFSPEGRFYFLDENDAGDLVRRSGLDHEAVVVASLNDHTRYVQLDFDNGGTLQMRIVRSACPELLRLHLVIGYSPQVEYSRE